LPEQFVDGTLVVLLPNLHVSSLGSIG
jgi:hypothetical protein